MRDVVQRCLNSVLTPIDGIAEESGGVRRERKLGNVKDARERTLRIQILRHRRRPTDSSDLGASGGPLLDRAPPNMVFDRRP
eukprot:353851-Pyramimonas_sp.AAC.1